MDINVNDFTPRHKYIRFYETPAAYQEDVDNHVIEECAYSLVNKGNLVERREYQPSHRTTNNDNLKIMHYLSEDVIERWAGLKIIWGYFGWEEETITLDGEQLLGGHFFKVKPMDTVYTVPDLYQYQHLKNFLTKVSPVNNYEPQDFSTIKSASFICKTNISSKNINIPASYFKLNSIKYIYDQLFDFSKTNNENQIIFESDVLELNNVEIINSNIFTKDNGNLVYPPTYNCIIPKLYIPKIKELNDYLWMYIARYYVQKYRNIEENININSIEAITDINNIQSSNYAFYCLLSIYTIYNMYTTRTITFNIPINNIFYKDIVITDNIADSIKIAYKIKLNNPENIILKSNIIINQIVTGNHYTLNIYLENVTIDLTNKYIKQLIVVNKNYLYSTRIYLTNITIKNAERIINESINFYNRDNASIYLNNVIIDTYRFYLRLDIDKIKNNSVLYLNNTNEFNLYTNYVSYLDLFNKDENSIFKNTFKSFTLDLRDLVKDDTNKLLNFEYTDLRNISDDNSNFSYIYLYCKKVPLLDESNINFKSLSINHNFSTIYIEINSDNGNNININNNIFIFSKFLSYDSINEKINKHFILNNTLLNSANNTTINIISNVKQFNEYLIIDINGLLSNIVALTLSFESDYIKINSINNNNILRLRSISISKIKILDLTDFIIEDHISITITNDNCVNYKLNYGLYSFNLNDLNEELDFTIWHNTLLINITNPELNGNIYKNPKNYNVLTLNRLLYNKFTDEEKEQLISCWKTINIRENES